MLFVDLLCSSIDTPIIFIDHDFPLRFQLEKLTTVQATGVASSLVESIQGSGFKLQTLSLSFEDQEIVVV